MKHRLLLLSGSMLLFMLILLGAEFNLADASNYPAAGTINCPLARVRSGPGIDYGIVTTLSSSNKVTILKQQADWYQVQTAEIEGWVASSLIDISKTASSSPVKSSLSTSTAPGKIRVKLNDSFLNLEVDPIIINGRTLVPLRAIFEALGATVNWDGSKQKVIASRASAVVELTIGSRHPTVNGQDWPLEVPAQIVNGRTLAPLRFVAEAFGSQVNWDANTQIVSINSSTVAKVIAVTVIDAQVNLREAPSAESAKVDIARSGERMPVLAEKDGWYQVSRGGKSLWLASWLVNPESELSSSIPLLETIKNPTTNQPPTDLLATNGIHLESSKDSNGLRIMLVSSENFDPEIKEQAGQITFQCKDRQITGVNLIEEKLGGQKFIAQASNLAKDTLVNVSIPVNLEYKIQREEGGRKLVVFVPNCITKVEKVPYGSVGERIIVSSLCPVNHSEKLLGNKLEIRLNNIQPGPGSDFSCSSNLIKALQFNRSPDNPQDMLISIDTNELGKFSTATTGDNKDLSIFLVNKQAIQNRSNIIVLDPGHGGSEPGTHGKYLIERDPNLAVGLKVGEILKSKGFQVEYTRCDDSLMELEQRAGLANDLNAAIFVSIHHNGATPPSACGTETYFYAPLENPELFIQRDERSRLANLIQNELVGLLGRNNRGVKDHRAFAVLLYTKMPSALTEIAFLTNPEEEQLVQQKEFKDLAAQAIANGIISYLENKRK